MEKCIVEIVEIKNSNHISTNGSDKCLCGKGKKEKKIKRLQDFEDPKDADSTCLDCLNRYKKCVDLGIIKRLPTVKCKCERNINNNFQKCNKVVSAYKARELKHPNSPNISEPICSDCYNTIRSVKTNSVTTKYKNANSWL